MDNACWTMNFDGTLEMYTKNYIPGFRMGKVMIIINIWILLSPLYLLLSMYLFQPVTAGAAGYGAFLQPGIVYRGALMFGSGIS